MLKSNTEYLAAEEVQRKVWRFPEREIIPLNELVVAQKNGGFVFGGFLGKKMVAFCFGCAGYRDGKPFHYSRMLGILKRYQNQGVGYRMKLFQREFVLRQGLNLARWTFDPLQGRNARFNIGKLGCVSREYLVNFYGNSGSAFNEGLDTDRFVVQWHVKSRRVRDVLSGARTQPTVDDTIRKFTPAIESTRTRDRLRDRRISIEIPWDIDALKIRDLQAAKRWRERTRRCFVAYFKRGYVLTGFAFGSDGSDRRSFYRLERSR